MIVPVAVAPPGTPFTYHCTDGGSPVTLAVSWTLVPVSMLAGAPEIETVGTAGEPVSTTVATEGVRGNSLFGSYATYVNVSEPAKAVEGVYVSCGFVEGLTGRLAERSENSAP